MKSKLRNQKGFTIIEVLIVLAIAGLILLIVFLAVPALQRNSRNTQRKNDISALLAAINEFSNNNNGKNANTCSGNSPVTFNITPTAGTPSEAKTGYYNLGCATGEANTNGHVGLLTAYGATGPYTAANQDFVTIVPAARCAANGATTTGSARQWAAVYMIESGTGSYSPACQDS